MGIVMGDKNILYSLIKDDKTVKERIRYFDFQRDIGSFSNKNFVIAIESGQVVGLMKWGEYGYDEKYMALSFISVDPKHQRRGIAKKMVNALKDELQKMNIADFRLSHMTEKGKETRIDLLFSSVMNPAGIRIELDMMDLEEFGDPNKEIECV